MHLLAPPRVVTGVHQCRTPSSRHILTHARNRHHHRNRGSRTRCLRRHSRYRSYQRRLRPADIRSRIGWACRREAWKGTRMSPAVVNLSESDSAKREVARGA